MIRPGVIVEIEPSYWIDVDGTRRESDELGGCEATVIKVHIDHTADVQVLNGPEVNLSVGRLRRRGS